MEKRAAHKFYHTVILVFRAGFQEGATTCLKDHVVMNPHCLFSLFSFSTFWNESVFIPYVESLLVSFFCIFYPNDLPLPSFTCISRVRSLNILDNKIRTHATISQTFLAIHKQVFVSSICGHQRTRPCDFIPCVIINVSYSIKNNT
jgi:hypothetical protein